MAKKHRAEAFVSHARLSRQRYFKAIKKAKHSHWADFLAKTIPHNIWTAKKFVPPQRTPRFPELPRANSPAEINEALLRHFFPPKPELLARGRRHRHPSAIPLTKEGIASTLAKSSPSSAKGPDGVPYSVWKKINTVNPDLFLELLAPLAAFGYHPATLKHANGVVLNKLGKPSYDTQPPSR